MASQETEFAQFIRNVASRLAAVVSDCREIENIWTHRLYSARLAEKEYAEITKTQMTDGITMAINLVAFVHNQAHTEGDYAVTIDVLRNDK